MINLFPLIPLSIGILFAIKVVLIYVLAVNNDHVDPFYPYLSDSGTTHPEAGYFSMLLNLEAILIGIFGWIRFKQIRYILSNDSNRSNKRVEENQNQTNKMQKYNKYGLYFSIICMLCIAGVAAFRSTEHILLHGLAAIPAFVITFFNYSIQIWISYKLIPNVNTKRMAVFRLIVAIFAFISAIIMTTTIIVSINQLKVPHNLFLTDARLKWNSSQGGYIAHAISAIAENMLIFSVCPFYLSFVSEFNRIKSKNGRLKFTFIGETEASTPI